jgi:hypothetical protein
MSLGEIKWTVLSQGEIHRGNSVEGGSVVTGRDRGDSVSKKEMRGQCCLMKR